MIDFTEQILNLPDNATIYLHIEETGVTKDGAWTAWSGTQDAYWRRSYGASVDLQSFKRLLRSYRPTKLQRLMRWISPAATK